MDDETPVTNVPAKSRVLQEVEEAAQLTAIYHRVLLDGGVDRDTAYIATKYAAERIADRLIGLMESCCHR